MCAAPKVDREAPGLAPHRRRGVWGWVAVALLIAVIALTIAADLMLRRAAPILKGRVVETLSARFDSRVELDVFDVSVRHGIDVSGRGLRIFPPEDVAAAGAVWPLIDIQTFGFHAGLRGLFLKPTHIGTVHVSGMTINIPPRQMREQGSVRQHTGKIKVLVDTLVFEDSRLLLQNGRPNKDPKVLELRHIEMHDYGGTSPLRYDALLLNAIPRGEIHAGGTFGPWDTESPGDSTLTGHYSFDRADLNTIHGLGGTLHSVGEFSGQLNRIEVSGVTDTPDFSLDSANHPMPLHTKFQAIVDGLSGDTKLAPVQARLGRSDLVCQGDVINVRGKGHLIDLDVEVANGHIDDFLRLAMKSPPLMTGRMQMHSRLKIPPGRISVAKKISLHSAFSLRQIRFTNRAMAEKVDALSLRAQGKPKDAVPGTPDVSSTMKGECVMRDARVEFSRLDYGIPGGRVELAGSYSVDDERLDFTGDIRTEAKLSQMVTSRWKSWLLKPVDPFFHKAGSGAVIPIRISGTTEDPKFSLAFGYKGRGQSKRSVEASRRKPTATRLF